jgi:hypothetical protein
LPFSFTRIYGKLPKNLEIGKLEIFELKNLKFNGSGFSGLQQLLVFFLKIPTLLLGYFLGRCICLLKMNRPFIKLPSILV